MATSAVVIEKRSRNEPRLTAEIMPTERPMTSHTTTAPAIRYSVFGSRSSSCERTSTSLRYERPKSKWKNTAFM